MRVLIGKSQSSYAMSFIWRFSHAPVGASNLFQISNIPLRSEWSCMCPKTKVQSDSGSAEF